MIDLSLLQDFIIESREHLEEMESSLLRLEKEPDNIDILNDIFRSMHTIKGASQFVGLERMSELSHKLENLLDLLRQGEKQLNQEIIDMLIKGKDCIADLTDELENSQVEETEIDDLLSQIKNLIGETEEEAPEEKTEDVSMEALETDEAAEAPGEKPDEKPDEEIDTEMLDDEALDEEYNEEYDKELFNIFIKQMQENISFLRSQIEELDASPNKTEVLNRCIDSIKSLQSAANYMSYEKLTLLYKNWGAEVDKAIGGLSLGKDVSLAFMNTYLDKVVKALPQVTREKEAEAEAGLTPVDELETVSEEPDILLEEDIGLPLDVSDKMIGPEDLAGEIYEEEYDKELFNIFIQQMQENVSFLRSQIEELGASPNKTEALNRCADSIRSLGSAANYMSYEKLTLHYKNWDAQVAKAREALSLDKDISFDFMNAYFDNVVKAFPQLEEEEAEAEEAVVTSVDEMEAVEEVSDLFSHEKLDLSPNVLDEKELRAEEVVKDDQEEALASVEELETASEATDIIPDDKRLFDKLNGAFDSSMDENIDTDVEPLHGVIEEMLFTGDEEKPEESPSIQEVPETETVAASQIPPPEEPVYKPEKTRKAKKKIPESKVDRRKTDRRILEQRKSEDPGERIIKQSVRVDADKIDFLMNQVGELVVSRAYFAQLLNEMRTLQQDMKENFGLDTKGLKPVRELTFRLGEATVALGRVSNELQEGVMKVRMLPISQLFNRYPRLVRDLVHKTDKQVELEIKGEETELDKMIIEELSDPLIHIIRNAIDHGIETAQERKRAGKPETSVLVLSAFHESNHIVIEVKDDGRGIDPERVRSKAIEKGFFSEDEFERMSAKELARIIMMPGFSTVEKATETSGRGVGMDVVKKNIEKLNGTVEIESEVGVQTLMRIKIPLTLAIIQALMVRVGPELFTIPLSAVEETLRIFEAETSSIEGAEVIHLRDTTMPIFRLSDIFNIKADETSEDKSFVVIVGTGMQQIGIVVDELKGQEEVVIKPLVDYLQEKSGFSGATIIGDGRISLILDIYELVQMTTEKQVKRHKSQAMARRMEPDEGAAVEVNA